MTYILSHIGGDRAPLKLDIGGDGDEYFDIIISNAQGQIGSVSLKFKGGNLVVHAEDWTTPHEPGTLNASQVIAKTIIVANAAEATPLQPLESTPPVPGPRVTAKFYSDDHNAEAEFDAAPWLAQASDDAIREVAGDGWGASFSTDAIAEFMSDHDPGVSRVYEYLGITHEYNIKMPYSKESVGSTCRVDEDEALAWLKENKLHIYEELTADREE
jgi:hypothetical protein